MKLSELLDQLRTTHHRGRIQIMVAIGRRPELAVLLGQMRTRGFYLRHMALFAAMAAEDGETMERTALSDPSRILRRMAAHQAARLCTDEQVARLLEGLPGKFKRLLIIGLQKRHRQPLVDQWLQSQGEPTTETLGFAGQTLLEKYKAQILERASAYDWTRITRRNPQWAATNVLQPRSGQAIAQLRATLVELAEQRHPEALPLWLQAREQGYTSAELPEDYLFQQFPHLQSEWALKQPEGVPNWPFQRLARRVSFEQCRQMLRRGWLYLDLNWWRRRPVQERLALFLEFRDELVGGSGAISPHWLEGLPHPERVEEARHQSLLPVHQLEPQILVEFLAMLGYEEGQAALLTLMQNPDVEIRSLGLRGFTRLGRYQPECRLDVLQILMQRQNEADPVRAAFLDELANLPPSGWNPTHFKSLGEILKAALNAADASNYTFTSAERLVLGIVPFQPAWSAPWLAKLLRHRGQNSVYAWSTYLEKPGSAEALDEDLSAVLAEWIARERFSAAWSLCSALGKRLADMPGLIRQCVAVCDHPQAAAAQGAFAVLVNQAGSVCVELIPRLLQADTSWFDNSHVRDFVHRHRQDLVDLALGGEVVQGKFASGLTRWVIPFQGGFWRWTPDQQFGYSERLCILLRDEQASFLTMRTCLRSLAQLPSVQPGLLQEFAALQESRQAVRDEALRALGRMDAVQGVPFLLDCLEDDRGRIAIYALRRAFLTMPVAAALEQLTAITSPRITVQKEVVRLLGDLAGGAGLPVVLQRLDRGDAHRDVYLAQLRALWQHLDDERVWPHLVAAAASRVQAVGQQLAVIPAGRHGAAARERLNGLLLQLLHHPVLPVRCAVMERLTRQPVEDPEDLLLQPVLARLSQAGREGELAGRVLRRKYDMDAESWGKLLTEMLPERQALSHLIRAFMVQLAIYSVQRTAIRPHLLATIEALQPDPATLLARLEMAAYRLSQEEFFLAVESDPAHWDLPLNWASLMNLHAGRLDKARWDLFWERWSHHENPHLRRLCLETLLIHTKAFGWSAESRVCLRHFQADSSGLVTGRSHFVFPPPEKL